MHLCKQICSKTKGEYRVVKNEQHFSTLLMEHVQPPKVLQEREAEEKDSRSTFIEMGFPIKHLAIPPEEEDVCSIPCPW